MFLLAPSPMPPRSVVKLLQQSLVRLGYPLPRWGADGLWGEETETALARYLADHESVSWEAWMANPKAFAEQLASSADAAGSADELRFDRILDVRGEHAARQMKGRNPWSRIDTICLHQMACAGPGSWERWKDLAIHFAVLRSGLAAQLYDCDALLWHGHGWNGRSVGLEIEGWYAGVEGDPRTLWTPPGAKGDRKKGQALDDGQTDAALQAIRLAVATVAAHGGRVRYIAAHRQSFGEKRSDPGSLIWQQVALPAMAELGLVTAPTLKDGLPIPEAWDPDQRGVPY